MYCHSVGWMCASEIAYQARVDPNCFIYHLRKSIYPNDMDFNGDISDRNKKLDKSTQHSSDVYIN